MIYKSKNCTDLNISLFQHSREKLNAKSSNNLLQQIYGMFALLFKVSIWDGNIK